MALVHNNALLVGRNLIREVVYVYVDRYGLNVLRYEHLQPEQHVVPRHIMLAAYEWVVNPPDPDANHDILAAFDGVVLIPPEPNDFHVMLAANNNWVVNPPEPDINLDVLAAFDGVVFMPPGPDINDRVHVMLGAFDWLVVPPEPDFNLHAQ